MRNAIKTQLKDLKTLTKELRNMRRYYGLNRWILFIDILYIVLTFGFFFLFFNLIY